MDNVPYWGCVSYSGGIRCSCSVPYMSIARFRDSVSYRGGVTYRGDVPYWGCVSYRGGITYGGSVPYMSIARFSGSVKLIYGGSFLHSQKF